VLIEEPAHRLLAAPPARGCRWIEQDVVGVVAQLAAKPLRERKLKATLGRIENRIRDPAPQGAPQDPLALPAGDLQLAWQRGRELH
jgi:hypothetical protein